MGGDYMEGTNENSVALAAIQERVIGLEQDRERNSKQHAEFYTRFTEITVADAVRENKQDQILEKLTSVERKVDAIEAKPAKRLNGIIDEVVKWGTMIVLGLVAYYLGVAF